MIDCDTIGDRRSGSAGRLTGVVMGSATSPEHRKESAFIEFGRASIVAPFLETAARIAGSIDLQRSKESSPSALEEAATRVRDLGLAELLPELDARTDGVSLLFHIADVLGHANVPATWQALRDVPGLTAPKRAPRVAVALPIRPGDAASGRWALYQPLDAPENAATVALLDPQASQLLGPFASSKGGPSLEKVSSAKLLGFPAGTVTVYTVPAGAERSAEAFLVMTASERELYATANLALLMGLISGGTRRLVEEAYAYSRIRRSFGKPLAQHQAVALRLADIAVHHEALTLYLRGAVEQGEAVGVSRDFRSLETRYVTELAYRVSRDAVQIAAGYGYVDGMPFKPLFEQTRTLVSALTLFRNSAAAFPAC